MTNTIIIQAINGALDSDQTSITYYEQGKSGKGCIFRDQTDLSYFPGGYDQYKVFPASFLNQDLIAPNPAYNIEVPDIIKKQGAPAIGTLAFDKGNNQTFGA